MKKILSIVLTTLLLLGVFAPVAPAFAEEDVIEVTFPTYLAGENVGAIFFLPEVERFNEKYDGQYKIVIEEVPQAAYAEKIKQLALQDQLPVLVHSPGSGGIDRQWFDKVIVANDMAYDLTDFAERNPEVADVWMDASREYCTYDGKLLVKPAAVTRPIGLYYNETMYQPETSIGDLSFDEFLDDLGDNKIALMTGENAWTTGLLLSAIIANEEGGAEFLNAYTDEKLYDYTDELLVNAFDKLQDVFANYASANAVGAAYAEAANAFMSKAAAVICNGSWMAGDFTEESTDKWSNGFTGDDVKADIYPGNVAIGSQSTFGEFWISNQASDEEKELAEAFLAFRDSQDELERFMLAEGGVAPNLDYSDEFIEAQKETRILSELSQALNDDTIYCMNILDIMPASVADAEFGKLLPKLVDGSMSGQEFAEELTRKAEEAR